MSADSQPFEETELHFHSSDHKMVGLEGSLVEKLRDNAPKAVGGLRLGSILMASVAHPLLGMHAFFVLGSEAILLLFGNRKSIEKHKTEEDENQSPNPLSKAIQPHKYPLESSAAMDVLGEIPHFILGASIVFGFDLGIFGEFIGEEAALHEGAIAGSEDCKEGFEPRSHDGHIDCVNVDAPPTKPLPHEGDYFEKLAQWDIDTAAWQEQQAAALEDAPKHNHLTGPALMLHGTLGVLAHLPLLLFGPEKAGHHAGHLDFVGDDTSPEHIEENLEFAESESKIVGTRTDRTLEWLKEHQMGISSALQVAIGVTMIIATGMPDIYRLAGLPLIAAGALQSALVTKRDFSAETSGEDITEKNVHSASHDGRLQEGKFSAEQLI